MNINNFNLNAEVLLSFLFVYYFCNIVAGAIIIRLFAPGWTYYLYNCFFLIILLCCFLLGKRLRLGSSLFVYSLIFFLILITLLFHPEYDSWLLEGNYSIKDQFLNTRGGIWAYLVVSMLAFRVEPRKFLNVLKATVWLNFIFYTLQFVIAGNRGYWISHTISGAEQMGRYNLAFGYHMLFR